MIGNIIYMHVLAVSGFSSLKSTLELVWLVILCILVIAASYFVTKYVGGAQIKKRKNSNFELLDACSLGSHKYLQIVKTGKRYFLMSVCKDNISLLAELAEDELEFYEQPSNINSFNEVLSKYIKKKNKNDDSKG